jgi:hypothetical protein
MATSLIGPIVGGLFANQSAGKAADSANRATDEATRLQREMFDKQIELTAPSRNAGNAALNRMGHLFGLTRKGFGAPQQQQQQPMPMAGQNPLMGMLNQRLEPEQLGGGAEYWSGQGASPTGQIQRGLPMTSAEIQGLIASQYGNPTPITEATPDEYGTDEEYGSLMRDFGLKDFNTDPGYQFRQDEGNKAMMRKASAGGGIYSGAAMKDAMRFNQGIASDEYGKAFDRFQVNRTNKINPLMSLSGMGQQSAGVLGAAGQSMANQVGGYQLGNANMQGAANITRGNALNSAFQNAWQGWNKPNQANFSWANKMSIDD